MKYDFANLGSDLVAATRADPFPMKFRMSKEDLYELVHAEWGSWEDARCPEGDSPHPCWVAQRHATVLEIRDAVEADRMYAALCSGTFALTEHDGGPRRLRIARRICDALKPYATAETLRLWKYPNGL